MLSVDGSRPDPAGDVHAQLHSPVSASDQLVGDTEAGQNLQGARLDRQRAGLVHPVQATVDEAGPDTEGGQLRSEGQPSRPGTDHENLDQPASHDADDSGKASGGADAGVVAAMASGQVNAYGVPYSSPTAAAGAPQQGTFIPFTSIKFRTVAVRGVP